MRRVKPYALTLLFVLSCFGGAVASTVDPHHAKAPVKAEPVKIAPADEYFGRLKLSILGIGNTIKDQTLKFDRRPDMLENEMGAVNVAVDAIRDWQHKYPRDPWIAKSLFFLERFYNRIPTEEGRARARATMAWLVRDFPQTWYGRTGKREMLEGKVGTAVVATPVLGDAVPVPAGSPQQ